MVEEIIITANGVNGQMLLYPNRIEIKRKGTLSFITHGMDGTKIIFLKSIAGLQYKESGKVTSGYLQIIFQGSQESKNGLFDATTDENTVMFAKPDEEEKFAQIKDYIISKI